MSECFDSVTEWIDGLREGSESAAGKLWHRYYERLVGLAYKKLRAMPRRVADEEDVVLEAFDSFCRRAKAKQFPDLKDRNDLWRLVVRITERKAYDQVRAQTRKKRGYGKVAGESVFAKRGDSSAHNGLQETPGPEPTPEFAAEMVESVGRLFEMLDDDELRQIAQYKLEGYTNEEIGEAIGRSLPTVERRLKMIREIWKHEAGDE
jgi:RNA polymerase sigma factor (sigma-70 family)